MRTLGQRTFAARTFWARTLHGAIAEDATSDHVEKGPLRRIKRPHGRELPQSQYDWLLPVALIALLDADEPY